MCEDPARNLRRRTMKIRLWNFVSVRLTLNLPSGEATELEEFQLLTDQACEDVSTWKYGSYYHRMANISASAWEMKGTIASWVISLPHGLLTLPSGCFSNVQCVSCHQAVKRMMIAKLCITYKEIRKKMLTFWIYEMMTVRFDWLILD